MAIPIPYDTSTDALLNPARNAVFFPEWNPEADNNQNHDLLCAEMSRLAYADEKVVTQSLGKADFSAVGFIGGDDPATRLALHGTQGFVAQNSKQHLTVLAFRGTESDKFDDLISDLETLQTDFRGCRVHTGFLKAYSVPVRERVRTLLQNREGSLLITGHSLGAALATLAATDTKPAALITFGSPYVGDARFCQLFNGLTVRRFVNCCDVVSRVPPEEFNRKHFLQLLTELGDFERFTPPAPLFAKTAAELAADALDLAFRGIASQNKFMHVAPPCYRRADGTAAEEISEEQRAQDQQDARIAYRHLSDAKAEQLLKLFRSLLAPSGGHERLRNFVRSLLKMNDGGTVPLRDLADHAPINYVSAFTGRKEQ